MMAGKPHRDDTDRQAEQRLIARVRRGDTEAARLLIDRHKDRLYAFVRRMIRNHHDAEEIVQDAMLKAFASLASFSTEYRFSTWLFTIAYRLCLNAMRRQRPLSGGLDVRGLTAHEPRAADSVAQSDAAEHLHRAVWRAVDRLSPPQRAAVVLFYRHEKSCQEIAQVLELPVATVKSHLHRARAKLKDVLEPVFQDAPQQLRILKGLAG